MKKELLLKTLALGIIVLFVGSGVVSAFNIDNKSEPLNNGNWLYVGGSGEGNYTKIQDAIDNASDGDTIYVFNGIYYENVRVTKSIDLLGENQMLTFIDGQETGGHVVSILAADVTFYHFTIQNPGGIPNAAALYVNSDSNQIIENIVTCIPHHGEEGIWLSQSSGNIISKNSIENHHYGIWLEDSTQNNLSNNKVTTSWIWGIILGNSNNNMLYQNYITENNGGIYLRDSSENMLFGNNITKNTRGVALVESVSTSSNNKILKNNFMKNKDFDASFELAKKSHAKNLWEENYWNRPLLLPKLIVGGKEFLFIPGIPFHFPGMKIFLPWFNFDWHPAKKPYDI